MLCVDERSFPFDQSDYSGSYIGHPFSNHGLSWSVGQRVELSLWEVPSKQGDWASLCLPPPPPTTKPTVSIEPVKARPWCTGSAPTVSSPRTSTFRCRSGQKATSGPVRRPPGGQRRGANRTYHQFQTTDDDTDEANGSVTVTVLPGPGYDVPAEPHHKATVRVADSDPGPLSASTVTIAADADEITEGQDAVFTITADPAPPFDLPVLLTIDTIGNYGVQSRRGQFIIPAGQTSATHTLPTDNDGVDEPNGMVVGSALCLGNVASAGCAIDFANDLARINVKDNDGGPEVHVSVAPGRITEGQSAVFTLTTDPATLVSQQVRFRVTVAGGDFDALVRGSGPIPQGETGLELSTDIGLSRSFVFHIDTTGDNVDEPNGQVTLTVLPASDYQLPVDDFSTFGIYDNDGLPGSPLGLRVGRMEGESRRRVRWDEHPEVTGYEVHWGRCGTADAADCSGQRAGVHHAGAGAGSGPRLPGRRLQRRRVQRPVAGSPGGVDAAHGQRRAGRGGQARPGQTSCWPARERRTPMARRN